MKKRSLEPLKEPDKKTEFVDSYELPAYNDATRLVLTAKDSYSIYAYWDIAPDAIKSLRSEFGKKIEKSIMILRMYDITSLDFNGKNANQYFDMKVGSETNSWYVNMLKDNVLYCGELGLNTIRGKFIPITRSNYIHTPPAHPSSRKEQIWMRVKSNANKRAYVKVSMQKINTCLSQENCTVTKNIYLSEEDIRRYYTGLTPQIREIISSRLNSLDGRRMAEGLFILEGENSEERRKNYSIHPRFDFSKESYLSSYR